MEIGFHSRAFGETFPHGLITLSGTVDSTGERVDANFGFTVRNPIGPSVLVAAVEGRVVSEDRDYVARSRRHFSLVLSDEEYAGVMALVERWRALPQPSYRLDRRNCVSFVAEILALLGLRVDPSRWMRRPRGFLEQALAEHRDAIAARQQDQAGVSASIGPVR